MTTRSVRPFAWVAKFILALTAVSATPADASPITFDFTTLTAPGGTLFGTGSFTFDDNLLESPTTSIEHPPVSPPDELIAFTYSDSIGGALGLNQLLGFDFSFGGVNRFGFAAFADPALASGELDVDIALNQGVSDNGTQLQLWTLTFPVQRTETAPIPEPTSLLLFGTGIAVLARRVRRCYSADPMTASTKRPAPR